MTVEGDVASVYTLADLYQELKGEVAKVIVGYEEVFEYLCITLLSRGHCLLIGVPGLAKTLLVKTLAEALALKFSRIQFTPDLMPGDITGTEILDENPATQTRTFRFVRGPIFANVILADEINRTPPKTQSALLEAMQEHHVTAAGTTYVLDEPFFVLATQNPIEQEGTYPLPEAQLDRFMLNVWLEYPTFHDELRIVKQTTSSYEPEIKKVMGASEIIAFQELVKRVPVADNVIEYAVRLVNSTRPTTQSAPSYIKKWIRWGAGPRASQYLILGAKARAILHRRFTPDIDDVRAIAAPVLRHRIITNFSAEAEGISSYEIVKRLLDETPVNQ
ncbi:MAG: AAA family ATPase [Bacteroidetes bacterium]|nr:AAA family ATPase [Bacteroidota bacterium]